MTSTFIHRVSPLWPETFLSFLRSHWPRWAVFEWEAATDEHCLSWRLLWTADIWLPPPPLCVTKIQDHASNGDMSILQYTADMSKMFKHVKLMFHKWKMYFLKVNMNDRIFSLCLSLIKSTSVCRGKPIKHGLLKTIHLAVRCYQNVWCSLVTFRIWSHHLLSNRTKFHEVSNTCLLQARLLCPIYLLSPAKKKKTQYKCIDSSAFSVSGETTEPKLDLPSLSHPVIGVLKVLSSACCQRKLR